MQGKAILQSLNYNVSTLQPIFATLPPWEEFPRIKTLLIPKNIHPETNQVRRKHRKKLIETLHKDSNDTFYMDPSYDCTTKTGRTAADGPGLHLTR